MLILPPGHGQALSARRGLSAREKWMISGVLGALAVLIAVVAVALLSAGHSTGNGCIDVNISSSLGNQEFYRCGAAARTMCASVDRPAGFSGAAGRAVAVECRKAGIPAGSSG